MIFTGTSGFSYDDWKGHFYPASMGKAKFLAYYSNTFTACEINSTYYAPASRRMTEGLLRKSEGRVTFCMKANRRMTHQLDADAAFYSGFRDALDPMVREKKLGAVLAQFPQSCRPDRRGKDAVERIHGELGELPLVFEFRQEKWADDRVFKWMSGRNIGLCCVDEPRIRGLFPPVVRVTSKDIAYLRFHGRNAEKWHNHKEAYERYDYLYSEEEIKQWVPKIKKLQQEAGSVFVFYNNHYKAKAVQNALQLKVLLEGGE
ncbi:MAG: DUF72 domain-containing protein [Pseudomonadota bacterium]